MAPARTRSVTLIGVDGVVVDVEVDLACGLPRFSLVGLPDTALSESRDRVRSALANSGEEWPQRRITVSLSPASVHKRGSGFDLAVACALTAASDALPREAIHDLVLIGELALDGRVRSIRGVLPAVHAAARRGVTRVIVPQANVAEANLVPDVDVVGAFSLRQLLAVLRGETVPEDELARARAGPEAVASGDHADRSVTGDGSATAARRDLAEVVGQFEGRRAVEICAAGGHHLLLTGPPGAGKTMLAERAPDLMPDLDYESSLEVTSIHSVAGTLPRDGPLLRRPPFSAPHHTATRAAIVGGGSTQIRPGAVSRAHRGVLFLDEAPEFAPSVLEALREPLESGEIVVARSALTVRLPARFQVILAANPCPCGLSGATTAGCGCSSFARRRYIHRLSGPLLDRVDVQVGVRPVSRAELLEPPHDVESTAVVAERVREARDRAARRLGETPWRTNAEVPGRLLRSSWRPDLGALASVHRAMDRGLLTARGLDRVLRVAWTVADLAGRDRPGAADVATALFFRTGVGEGGGRAA